MKHHLYKRALGMLLLFAVAAPAAARPLIDLGLSEAHEFSAHLGIGLSTFNYKLSEGKAKVGMGGTLGLGYTYFFNEFFGIHSGFGFSLYNAKAKVRSTTSIKDNYTTFNNGDTEQLVDIRLRSTLSPYTEQQRAYLLTIPVMLQFPPTEPWYGKVGVTMGIPISMRYRTTSATLSNNGYYDDQDNEMPPLDEKGIGEFRTGKGKAALKLTTSFMVSLEGGWKFPLPRELTLLAGVYFDYGLNDVGQGRTRYAAYDDPAMKPANFMPSSVLTSYRPADEGGKNQLFTKRVVPLTVGLKATVVMGGGASAKKAPKAPSFFNDWAVSRTGGKSGKKSNSRKAGNNMLKW